MTPLTIPVRRLPAAADLPLPDYASAGAAGVDLLAAIPATEILEPGQRAVIGTGIALAVPLGFEAQIRPRSGLAARHGVTVLNAPGTIDSDYRGEVGVVLINLGQDAFAITRGDRIAQLVVAPVTTVVWREVDQLTETGRGQAGFGSTGGATGGKIT